MNAGRPKHPFDGQPAAAGRWWMRASWRALAAALLACSASSGAAAEPADEAQEVRDMILMLETGPLHVRLHVAVGGRSPSAARRSSVEALLQSLDANGDGELNFEESQRSPLFREKQRPGANQFLKSIGVERTLSRKSLTQRIDSLGGETVVYRQNTETSDTDSQVFQLLDADKNGVITEAEMFNAVDLILAKDFDDDECVTLDEFAPPPDPNAPPGLIVPNTARTPAATVAEIVRDTHQTLLAAQMLRQYDADRSRKLSPAELGWRLERIAMIDGDHDGELDVRELGALDQTPTDVELAVDVVRQQGQPMLRVISTTGEISAGAFSDLATVALPSAVVTFSTRDVDPFETSMTIALRTFNELDGDGNGYLDRDETKAREQFGRGLFDQIDADGDGKIFGNEMKEFIRSRGEPVATTCQVTAYDDGEGFFSTLDANGDRRISIREMRYADKSLARMQRDEVAGIGEHEPARRYRIEFVRGIYNPFGTTERPSDMATTVSRPRQVGPIWFQRWDRNNDGDITWREFLGPRDAFEQLDVDRDDLIDPHEAEAAGRLAESNPPPQNSLPLQSTRVQP